MGGRALHGLLGRADLLLVHLRVQALGLIQEGAADGSQPALRRVDALGAEDVLKK